MVLMAAEAEEVTVEGVEDEAGDLVVIEVEEAAEGVEGGRGKKVEQTLGPVEEVSALYMSMATCKALQFKHIPHLIKSKLLDSNVFNFGSG
jgi:hypothetical protein